MVVADDRKCELRPLKISLDHIKVHKTAQSHKLHERRPWRKKKEKKKEKKKKGKNKTKQQQQQQNPDRYLIFI